MRRRVAASPLCFADFEVRRRKKGEGVRRCGEDKTWKGLDFETLRYIPRYLGAKEEKGGGGEAPWGQCAIRHEKGCKEVRFTDSLLESWIHIYAL